ncbi:MAG: TerB family tellurite resistance protein [Giesbergeria sp.]|nr:TerB family tellurite resistance protein [Giesbergeria sp.]
MRSYPRNSPEAAARIVALIMVADGHVSRSEMAALDRLHASTLLDLAPADMARVLRELSEDLMCTAFAPWCSSCRISEELLQALLTEVDDTELRASTLALCREVAQADAHLSDAEESLLAQTAQLWGLGTDRYLQPPPQRPMAMTL